MVTEKQDKHVIILLCAVKSCVSLKVKKKVLQPSFSALWFCFQSSKNYMKRTFFTENKFSCLSKTLLLNYETFNLFYNISKDRSP